VELGKKISQAKSKLLVEYPYFGSLASKLMLRVNDDLEGFVSDGLVLEYRQEYLEALSLEEMEFVLANGAMHAALAYETRKQKRSGWLWQMATDMAINDMLVQNGLKLPLGAHYRKRFEGMYAEEIYEELKSDMLHQEEDYTDENSLQESFDEETILQEQLFGSEASTLLEQHAKEDGKLLQTLERFFKREGVSKIDWKEELKEALEPFFQDDYTLLPPSKKLLSMGIYLPSTYSNTIRLVIAIDSSASVDEMVINRFLNEVDFLMELSGNYIIDLLVCDDKIHSHTQFVSGEPLELKLQGYGGTDFRPVFEYVQEEISDLKLLLYFSDLEGIFPQESPTYNVKWIAPKAKEVPFGEVIVID
jgi:predicted metal-dependent peptidase